MEAHQNKTTKAKYAGDKNPDFKPLALFGYLACYCCGEKMGPFEIKSKNGHRDPAYDYEDESQLAADGGLHKALLSGSRDVDDADGAWACVPCIKKNDLEMCEGA